jgi:UDP-N-acetylmuramate dehydrogenase
MQILSNYNLKHLNSFGVNCVAQYFVECNTVQQLHDIVDSSVFKENWHLVLGGGSNILFTKDVHGLVIKNNIRGIEVVKETQQEITLKVGAGEEWNNLVNYCVDKNFGGIENLSLIPGNVGAAPIQNIGAYGVEISSVLTAVEGVDLDNNSLTNIQKQDCKLGYRDSIFKHELKGKFIITAVYISLHKNPSINVSYGDVEKRLSHIPKQEITIKHVSETISAIRTEKLPNPKVLGNAGSFFKNVVIQNQAFDVIQKEYPSIPHFVVENGVKIPTAWLIEKCGFKGLQQGNVGCYKTQPLVIVNYGNATGQEVFDYSTKVILAVKQKFGILLEREVNIV